MIDSDTGLPDLSILGKGYYWEVSPKVSFSGTQRNRYVVKIMRSEFETRRKGLFGTTSVVRLVKVDYLDICRRKTWGEIDKKTIESIKIFMSLSSDSDLEKYLSQCNTYDLVERMMLKGSFVTLDDLIMFDLSDELILSCSTDLYNSVIKSHNAKMKQRTRDEKNKKFCGEYPPNKLGGVS